MKPEQKPAGEPRQLLLSSAILVYSAALLIGGIWLHVFDRLGEVPKMAVGSHGAGISLAAGAGVGFAIVGILLVLRRYLRVFEQLEKPLKAIVAPLGEYEIVGLSLVTALGEEFFFRGAMHEFWGYWSALVFGLFYSGPGLLFYGMLALLSGLLFSFMMEMQLGLLSVTVAHALINYFVLRRVGNL